MVFGVFFFFFVVSVVVFCLFVREMGWGGDLALS
jgi:hypothetical protein